MCVCWGEGGVGGGAFFPPFTGMSMSERSYPPISSPQRLREIVVMTQGVAPSPWGHSRVEE